MKRGGSQTDRKPAWQTLACALHGFVSVTRRSRVHSLVVVLAATTLAVATAADAAITFRAASSASVADGDITVANGAFAERTNCGSINPSIPARAAGDLLIAQVLAREDAATVTMAGWNTMYADNVAGENYQVIIFWRTATNTAADTNTITQSGTCNHLMARITRFGNVDPVQPFDFNAASVVYSDAGNVDTGVQDVNVANSLLVLATFVADNRTVAQPGTFTQLYDDSDTSGNDAGMSLNYRLESTTGTKGPLTNMDLQGGGNDPNHGLLFAVRPGTSSLTLNVPAGTVANDVMIASVTVRACSNTSGGACTMIVATPAGWTLVNAIDQTTGAGTDGFGNRLLVYSRVAIGAEPASYTWIFGGTPVHAGAAGGILSFAGADTVSPIVVSAGQATAASYNHAAPSIDTGIVTDTMLVSTHTINSSGTWTPPVGMTEPVDISSLAPANGLGLSIEMNYESFASSGATGARTATSSNPPANDTGATHMLALRPGAAIDHFEISFPNGATAVTCESLTVRITAHDAADAPVDVPAGTVMTFATTTGTGVWLTPTVAGTGAWAPSGLNDGQASYTWPGGESVLDVRVRHSTPLATIGMNLGGTYTEAVTEDPTATFVDSAFRVTDAGGAASVSIGTQIAGKDSNSGLGAQTLFLQAIRTDTNSGSCVGVFPSQTVSVQLASECNNPAACVPTPGSQVRVRNSAAAMAPIAQNNNAAVGSYSNVSLAFDAQSKAPLVLNYPDVGQITLHARYALPTPPSTFMVGSSNAFVVKPAGFVISNIVRTSDSFANPAAPDASGARFIGAGENFTVTVTAVANDGTTATPNFGRESAPEGVLLSQTLIAPVGGSSGALANATVPGSEFGAGGMQVDPNGSATVTNLNWSEVGIIQLGGQIADNDYLGGGAVPNSYLSTNVGRFTPAQYAVTTSAITPACTTSPPGFTYARQPFTGTMTIEAQNAAGVPTTNYRSGFDTLNPATELTFINNQTAGVYDDKLIGFVAGQTFSDTLTGRASLDLQFRWDMAQQAPVDTTVQLTGATDEVTTVAGAPVNVGSTNVRFGRLALENAFGSELLPLSMTMETEYYVDANTGFVRNGEDGCTALGTAELDLSNDVTDPPQGTPTITTNSGPPAVTTVGVDNTPVVAGAGDLTLTAPGDGGGGFADVSVDLSSRDWLRFDWDGGGAFDDDPSARATFGIYRGSPRQIFLRERY